MRILVTGAKGFIAGYLIEDLLNHGWEVTGLDNLSKYGKVSKSYDNHPNYKFVKGDAKDTGLLKKLMVDCDHFVAGAAMIGGIAYFHEFAYDLLAENERICASSFDAAIWAYKNAKLRKITVISSSMVFENATQYPTPEGHQKQCPPPSSTYGFQKLAAEYFTKGAYEQYKLPYTIVRPFNCVGIGEKRARDDRDIKSGDIKLALSHVVPDLVQKTLKGQAPLHILGKGQQIRHYTYGGDLAEGIRLSIEKDEAVCHDFNLSTDVATTVLELARLIWKRINPHRSFEYVCDESFIYDVQKRTPDTSKAKRILGFYAQTSLEKALDEVIPWIRHQIEIGGI
jgi:UDP-glucose 4-epimerase